MDVYTDEWIHGWGSLGALLRRCCGVARDDAEYSLVDLFEGRSLRRIAVPAVFDQFLRRRAGDFLEFRPQVLFDDEAVKLSEISAVIQDAIESELQGANLVQDDSEGIDVRPEGIAVSGHDLRRHVSRGTADFVGVAILQPPGHPEIEEAHVSFLVKSDIGGFQIPHHDFPFVQVHHTLDYPECDVGHSFVHPFGVHFLNPRKGPFVLECRQLPLALPPPSQSLVQDIVQEIEDEEETLIGDFCIGPRKPGRRNSLELDDVLVIQLAQDFRFHGKIDGGDDKLIGVLYTGQTQGLEGTLLSVVIQHHVNIGVPSSADLANDVKVIAMNTLDVFSRQRCY